MARIQVHERIVTWRHDSHIGPVDAEWNVSGNRVTSTEHAEKVLQELQRESFKTEARLHELEDAMTAVRRALEADDG